MDDEQQYAAASSRDARFDGVFVTAVRTTGIYCRPSCPAMTPRRENVVFYPTAAAAQGEDDGGGEFTGLVVGDRVRDVSGLGTMNELLARWDDAQCRLD